MHRYDEDWSYVSGIAGQWIHTTNGFEFIPKSKLVYNRLSTRQRLEMEQRERDRESEVLEFYESQPTEEEVRAKEEEWKRDDDLWEKYLDWEDEADDWEYAAVPQESEIARIRREAREYDLVSRGKGYYAGGQFFEDHGFLD